MFEFFCSEDTSLRFSTSCGDCGLFTRCKHPRLDGVKGTNDVLFILPPPCEEEDESGKCGDGYANSWLKGVVNSVGLNFDDCSYINVTGCTGSNKGATVNNCFPRLDSFIKEMKPKLVIVVGEAAMMATVGRLYSREVGSPGKWNRYVIPFYDWGCWLAVVREPKEILNHEKYNKNQKWKKASSFDEKLELIQNNGTYRSLLFELKNGLINAYNKAKEPLPPHIDSYTHVKVLSPEDSVLYLEEATTYLKAHPKEVYAFDTETTGIKLYNSGHSVYSMSMCYKDNESASFRVTDVNKEAIKKFLMNEFRWCGHNAKYDYVASKLHLGYGSENLACDTQILAHLYNNTPGTTSLKFNTFVFLGVGDYESDIHYFLEASEEDSEKYGTNAINHIYEGPEDKILYYGGKDTLYTRHLMKKLIREVNKNRADNFGTIYDLFTRGSIALANIELRGMKIDVDKITEHKEKCEREMSEILDKIEQTPTWKLWKDTYGDEASILSGTQTIDILYKKLKLFPKGLTRTTKYKSDADWLLRTDDPICPLIIRYKKLHKSGITYLTSFLRERNNDRLRCIYSLSSVRSFRGSSYDVNLQNVSAHSPEAVELLRTCFVPEEGYQIAESDFSALEMYVSYMYTNCSMLKKYLTEGDADMHSDTCKKAMMFTDEEWKHLHEVNPKMYKEARSASKKINFGFQYGSYYKLIGPTIWTDINDKKLMHDETTSVRDWLIKRLDMLSKWDAYKKSLKDAENALTQEEFFSECYTEHMRSVEADYWDRFKEVQEWRKKNYEDYLTNGYFRSKTGCTYSGYHSLNQTGNFPVQSTGFHILLWGICRIQQICKERGYKSYIANTIHDSIISYVKVEERDEYLKMVEDVLTNQVEKAFPFIKIHLGVEHEVAEVGQPWASKALYEYQACPED